MNRIVASSATSAAAGWSSRSRTTEQQERADRDVRGGRVERMAEPAPLRKSLSGRIGRKRALSQRWLKSPSGAPIDPGGDEAAPVRRRHAQYLLQDECIHRASTPVRSSGITSGRLRAKFVDKRRCGDHGPRTVHFVLPEGAGRTARPHRGAILGTVPGTRLEGRKAGERGTRRRPGTADLFVASGPVERRSPPVPSGAFVCAGRDLAGFGGGRPMPNERAAAERPFRVMRIMPRAPRMPGPPSARGATLGPTRPVDHSAARRSHPGRLHRAARDPWGRRSRDPRARV